MFDCYSLLLIIYLAIISHFIVVVGMRWYCCCESYIQWDLLILFVEMLLQLYGDIVRKAICQSFQNGFSWWGTLYAKSGQWSNFPYSWLSITISTQVQIYTDNEGLILTIWLVMFAETSYWKDICNPLIAILLSALDSARNIYFSSKNAYFNCMSMALQQKQWCTRVVESFSSKTQL